MVIGANVAGMAQAAVLESQNTGGTKSNGIDPSGMIATELIFVRGRNLKYEKTLISKTVISTKTDNTYFRI